ncbi:copper homeostasis protein CutC [Zooshikella ganghwensis]|uniref:copper homeostasis protein CutC n=1 Tax=Zooshikella ganghwensis TaxID=202772 RepID=UPI00040775E4|nr:copper homeostasis protein CutC [Zooshikella ganghwensis]
MKDSISCTKLEVCVDSVDGALIAASAGADRLELCGELSCGGLTPSIGLIYNIRDKINLPINVMLRPRAGDFCYSDEEFAVMKADLLAIKHAFPTLGGFVTGILTPEGKLDYDRLHSLIALAHPLSITLHRAFDMTKDPAQSLEVCLKLGVERILTAGFQHHAIDGVSVLQDLIKQAQEQLIIMPGSGLRASNLQSFLETVPAQEIHMSARKRVASNMRHQNPNIHMGTNGDSDEFGYYLPDAEEIKAAKAIISKTQGV